MTNSRPKKAAKAAPKGKVVATVPGFFLVKPQKKAAAPVTTAAPADRADALLSKAAKALNRPGISKDAVFKGRTNHAYSYSVDTSDVTRVVRVSHDGRRSVGRLVGEKFVPLKTV